MSDDMEECIGRIEGMVREDRLKQWLKEGKTRKARLAATLAAATRARNPRVPPSQIPLLFLAPTMITMAASSETSNFRILVVSMSHTHED